MSNFNFLDNLVIVDTGRQRLPKDNLTPSGLTLRVTAEGRVYPSEDLVTQLDLAYNPKQSLHVGNGLDIVDSALWPPIAHLPRVILLGLVSKTNRKVDLFGNVKFHTDGTPRSNVLTQGGRCPELLALVRELDYLQDDQAYCDLVVRTDAPIRTERDIANIPKVIAKGDRRGQSTTERRESIVFYHAVPAEELVEVEQEADQQEVQLITQ